YKLLSSSPNELRYIYEIEEGIENRLIAHVSEAHSFADFMTQIKTKRYTWTRLQRICLHILTNTKKNEMNVADKPVPYLRLLGMTEAGRQYLNKMKKQLSVPVISKLSAYGTEISLDIRAAKLYNMVLPHNQDQEYKETPIYIKQTELT
ncbi:MAG: nucleotidyltransferase family protein, partial [Bacillus sp. (in: firmicutes)]